MMPEIRVWAPEASRVDLALTDGDHPMEPAGEGWWQAGTLPHGTDYAFRLDGGDPLPDPRSPWQPQGVHAASRTYDPATYTWGDGAWAGRSALGAVIYELHVGTFTPEGTLDAAAGRLDHLVDLGVDMVELMPVAAFPGRYGWGYDGVALYAVHEAYGGPAALQRFVDACHQRGLAVCLDVVYNHLGPSGNYLGAYGPYFTDRHETPWGSAVNLDGTDAGPVRAFIVDNAVRWLRDFHLDALRLDAVHALVDDSPTHILAELSTAVERLKVREGRPLSLIAESDRNDPRTVTPVADGGLGMDAQWADDVHHALHAYLTGERHGYYADFGSPEVLAKALRRVFVHDGSYSSFRGETWGSPVPDDVDGRRFVVFAQDHDQVGNRALGDRPSRVLDDGQLAVAAALVLLAPMTPMLFMGEEWGARTPFQYFTDHAEPELGEAIRAGRTAEFGSHGWAELYGGTVDVPDPQAPSTAHASRLDWSEPQQPDHARLLRWYRDLIALRHQEPELADGDRRATEVRVDEHTVTLRRGRFTLLANHGTEPVALPADGTVVAAFGAVDADDGTVHLRAHTVAVLRGPEG